MFLSHPFARLHSSVSFNQPLQIFLTSFLFCISFIFGNLVFIFLEMQCLISVAETERIHSGILQVTFLLMHPDTTVAFLAT